MAQYNIPNTEVDFDEPLLNLPPSTVETEFAQSSLSLDPLTIEKLNVCLSRPYLLNSNLICQLEFEQLHGNPGASPVIREGAPMGVLATTLVRQAASLLQDKGPEAVVKELFETVKRRGVFYFCLSTPRSFSIGWKVLTYDEHDGSELTAHDAVQYFGLKLDSPHPLILFSVLCAMYGVFPAGDGTVGQLLFRVVQFVQHLQDDGVVRS